MPVNASLGASNSSSDTGDSSTVQCSLLVARSHSAASKPDALHLQELRRRAVAERTEDRAGDGALRHLEVAQHLVLAEEAERVALGVRRSARAAGNLLEQERPLEVQRFTESRRHVRAAADQHVIDRRRDRSG